MTNARRALLVSAAVAAAVPALAPATASADPIVRCSPTFLLGPVRCAAAAQESQVREDNPEVAAILEQYVDPLL
jgi:hypothetical protein